MCRFARLISFCFEFQMLYFQCKKLKGQGWRLQCTTFPECESTSNDSVPECDIRIVEYVDMSPLNPSMLGKRVHVCVYVYRYTDVEVCHVKI